MDKIMELPDFARRTLLIYLKSDLRSPLPDRLAMGVELERAYTESGGGDYRCSSCDWTGDDLHYCYCEPCLYEDMCPSCGSEVHDNEQEFGECFNAVSDCSVSCGMEYVSEPYPFSTWVDPSSPVRNQAEYIQHNIGKAHRTAGFHVHVGPTETYTRKDAAILASLSYGVLMRNKDRILGCVEEWDPERLESTYCNDSYDGGFIYDSKGHWLTINSFDYDKPCTTEVRAFSSFQDVDDVVAIMAPAVKEIEELISEVNEYLEVKSFLSELAPVSY